MLPVSGRNRESNWRLGNARQKPATNPRANPSDLAIGPTSMAPSRDAVDEKVTAAVGVDTRSITSSCYRAYLAEFRRKSRPTMGVLPGLACASILNTNSSCPPWVSRLIR